MPIPDSFEIRENPSGNIQERRKNIEMWTYGSSMWLEDILLLHYNAIH